MTTYDQLFANLLHLKQKLEALGATVTFTITLDLDVSDEEATQPVTPLDGVSGQIGTSCPGAVGWESDYVDDLLRDEDFQNK